jgi:predicted  nucleic acid-binding Zn-ribbon protein
VSLPAADELFRSRHEREARERRENVREMAAVPDAVPDPETPAQPSAQPSAQSAAETAAEAKRRSSGRVRHDEKMTVYVTADELLDIEHARLSLRRHQALAVDRGRLVREAIAIALEDLEANGDDSVLVRRLIGR